MVLICQLSVQWCVSLLWTPPLCPPGDAAASQNQEESRSAPLIGEDAEVVEQLRRVSSAVSNYRRHFSQPGSAL